MSLAKPRLSLWQILNMNFGFFGIQFSFGLQQSSMSPIYSYLGADEAVPHYGLMGPVKAALESLVRYMALELGPQGVRVYAVSPGPILTRAASGIEAFDTLMQNNIAKAPLGRLVTLEEIANLSTFLCTDAASGMTGQTIYVDAGSHAVN